MGFEIENKYRVANVKSLELRLNQIGAKVEPPVAQADTYLAHPARDFATTNEAFRIRRDGEHNRLTYKGPKHEGPTKTREEIEIAFAEGESAREEMLALFDRLGFRPVATISKTRRSHHLIWKSKEFEVTIDDAHALGTFVEIETLAEAREALASAQSTLMELATELGLTEVEPRSYLRMHLEKEGLLQPRG